PCGDRHQSDKHGGKDEERLSPGKSPRAPHPGRRGNGDGSGDRSAVEAGIMQHPGPTSNAWAWSFGVHGLRKRGRPARVNQEWPVTPAATIYESPVAPVDHRMHRQDGNVQEAW